MLPINVAYSTPHCEAFLPTYPHHLVCLQQPWPVPHSLPLHMPRSVLATAAAVRIAGPGGRARARVAGGPAHQACMHVFAL
jgi:hypothetical protein